MAVDLVRILEAARKNHWALSEFDWDAPGADSIARDPRRQGLERFMADLVWIELLGSRAFAGLAMKAPSPILRDIYLQFEAEERRHANAELALMRRWRFVREGELPVPNKSIQIATWLLDRYLHVLPFPLLSAVIPLLEIALDGALLKFLHEQIDDPVCGLVFERINADESRHLAVGFHVMELVGRRPPALTIAATVLAFMRPPVLVGSTIVLPPVLEEARKRLVEIGLDPERLAAALRKYGALGARSADTRRNPVFHFLSLVGRLTAENRDYQRFARTMGRISSRVPVRWHTIKPPWVHLSALPVV